MSSYNLFAENEAINFRSGSFYARHRGCHSNTFTGNVSRDGPGFGFLTRDGAHHNVIERHTIANMAYALMFMDTDEDDGQQTAGDYNVYRDITITGGVYAIAFHDLTHAGTTSSGNEFTRLTVTGSSYLFRCGHRAIGNTLADSTLTSIPDKVMYAGGKGASDLGVTYSGNTLTNCPFGLP